MEKLEQTTDVLSKENNGNSELGTIMANNVGDNMIPVPVCSSVSKTISEPLPLYYDPCKVNMAELNDGNCNKTNIKHKDANRLNINEAYSAKNGNYITVYRTHKICGQANKTECRCDQGFPSAVYYSDFNPHQMNYYHPSCLKMENNIQCSNGRCQSNYMYCSELPQAPFIFQPGYPSSTRVIFPEQYDTSIGCAPKEYIYLPVNGGANISTPACFYNNFSSNYYVNPNTSFDPRTHCPYNGYTYAPLLPPVQPSQFNPHHGGYSENIPYYTYPITSAPDLTYDVAPPCNQTDSFSELDCCVPEEIKSTLLEDVVEEELEMERQNEALKKSQKTNDIENDVKEVAESLDKLEIKNDNSSEKLPINDGENIQPARNTTSTDSVEKADVTSIKEEKNNSTELDKKNNVENPNLALNKNKTKISRSTKKNWASNYKKNGNTAAKVGNIVENGKKKLQKSTKPVKNIIYNKGAIYSTPTIYHPNYKCRNADLNYSGSNDDSKIPNNYNLQTKHENMDKQKRKIYPARQFVNSNRKLNK